MGIAGRGELEPIRAFISDLGVDAFPHAVDESGELWATFGVPTQPAWAFIAADGELETVIGGLGADALAERLDALVAASA